MNNGKVLWKTLNCILGKKDNSLPSFIEIEGSFLTKPGKIANYFNLQTRWAIQSVNRHNYKKIVKEMWKKNSAN